MPPRRILVVDDDPEFLQELKETLCLSGYEVDAIDKSVNAVDSAIDLKPDLILLDLRMDGLTGFEVLKELRDLPQTSRIPIIVMSGHFNETQDCTLFDFFHIRDCLQKPFNPLDVISHIEKSFRDMDSSF
ncbi:MAG: response regulator [Candidatus Omnitrophota bacterium]